MCCPWRGRQWQFDQLYGIFEEIRRSYGEEILKGSQIDLDIVYILRKKPRKLFTQFMFNVD